MADKKISELPVASAISPADISVLVASDIDYQYSFTTLLSFIAGNLTVGAAISFGTAIPQNTSGNNGDVFFKTDTSVIYQKINGIWALAYTIPTGTGPDGTLLYGTGVPGSTIGADNDSYIDITTGIFYLRASGSWSQVFSMATGPQGPQGTPGTNGTNGTDGNSVLNGTTDPSNLLGNDGDFYINTSTFYLFGPKAAGVWPSGESIIGNDGPQGDKGDTGAAGPAGGTGPKGDKGDTGDTGPAGTDGATGATGAAGAAGATGPAGPGVPAGGSTGQVLAKNSNTDYDDHWVDPPAGVSKASATELNTGTDDTKFATAAGLTASKYTDQSGSKIAATATGTDTYAAAISPAITAYAAGQSFYIKFSNGNTGAATINLNALGAKSIIKNGASALVANDIVAGQVLCLSYDGTNFQVIGSNLTAIPTVTTGEKALSITSAGVQKNYDMIDQVVSASSLTGADFSTGLASVTGQTGQISYDSNYRYDCVGLNSWRRAALNGSLLDLYLADIDDSAGDKTSSDLQTAYSASVMGQQVWGTNNLYIKKTSTQWAKFPYTIA